MNQRRWHCKSFAAPEIDCGMLCVACSLDDTMTDLMCHPESFEAWSQRLDRAASPCPSQGDFPASPDAAAPPARQSDSPSRADDAARGEALHLASKRHDAAGHSGMMRLAAGIIKDLAEHRLLFELLEPAPREGRTAAGEPRCSSALVVTTCSVRHSMLVYMALVLIGLLNIWKLMRRPSACSHAHSVNGIGVAEAKHAGAVAALVYTVSALSAHSTLPICRQAPDEARGSRWSIVVTGHSLGAGIAAFVGMHLRRVYFDVQVWCYNPPGWLMTPELAESGRDFVTSVVVNKDWVPRCAGTRVRCVHSAMSCTASSSKARMQASPNRLHHDAKKICACCLLL